MFMHSSCICTNFVSITLIFNCLVLFCVCVSLSLFLSVSCSMAPKRKSTLSRNAFHSRASFSSSPFDSTPPMSGFVMIKPVWTFRRTSHDEAFIWNAKLFYWIFPILTFPLSPIVGVGSHLSLHDHTRVLLQYAQI